MHVLILFIKTRKKIQISENFGKTYTVYYVYLTFSCLQYLSGHTNILIYFNIYLSLFKLIIHIQDTKVYENRPKKLTFDWFVCIRILRVSACWASCSFAVNSCCLFCSCCKRPLVRALSPCCCSRWVCCSTFSCSSCIKDGTSFLASSWSLFIDS